MGEDPATGSSNCLLGPYWTEKLGKKGEELSARQLSARGGEVKIVWDEQAGKCKLRGKAVVVMRGELLELAETS